jgi:hypothetical protein
MCNKIRILSHVVSLKFLPINKATFCIVLFTKHVLLAFIDETLTSPYNTSARGNGIGIAITSVIGQIISCAAMSKLSFQTPKKAW